MNDEHFKPSMELPFSRPPAKGEILGSWLSGLKHVNGRGAWNPFAARHGFQMPDGKAASPCFLVPKRELVEPLLLALGYRFDDILRAHTTFPYWARFGTRGGHVSIGRVQAEHVHTWAPRICAGCVAEDVEELGFAYWHREHQLPNVLACMRHRMVLRHLCEACSRLPRPVVRYSPPPMLTPFCDCGADLRLQRRRLPASHPHWQLVRVSVEALQSDLPPFDWKCTKRHLTLEVRRRGLQLAQLRKDAADVFSVSECAGVYLRPTDTTGTSTRDICADLAMMGIDLEALRKGLSSSPSTSPVSGDRVRRSTQLREAKKLFLARRAAEPHRHPSTFRAVYWILRLLDEEWLRKQVPSAKLRQLPSIAQDRAVILEESRAAGWPGSSASKAYIRAKIRDPGWLGTLRQRVRERATQQRLNARAAERRLPILAAIDEIVQRVPPVRVTCGLIAQASGLPAATVVKEIDRSSDLQAARAAANASKKFRQVKWAAQVLTARGRPLRVVEWCTLAKVLDTPEVRGMMDAVRTELVERSPLSRV